ncbi:MAG: ATP-binding protein [Clostridia bacterium]
MTRTLFGKLILIISVTLIVTFIVTGFALFAYLQQTMTASKVSELKLAAEDVGNIYNEYLGETTNPIMKNIFQRNIARIEQTTGALIWIADTNGRIIDGLTDPAVLKNTLKFDGTYYSLGDPRQTSAVLKTGEDIQTSGDFYGLFKSIGQDILTVAELKQITAEGLSGQFIVYSFVKMPEVYQTRQNAINMYIAWGAIAILGVLLSLYFITRRITKPIKEMSIASARMAKGEMGQRVTENSKDEIGQLARSFNAMAVSLENLENMRRDFIANVSHELRTPMTSMRGFIDAMLDGTIEPNKRDYYLQIVREETTRLSRLVDDLLDLSRMQSGKLSAEMFLVDLNELVRRSVIKLESLILQKNIVFETSFDEADCKVKGDSDLLDRVMINLISNAIKFTPENGAIKVATRVEGNKVFVSVSDTGEGMSAENLSQVFERFYKADKSRGAIQSGTGLGLSIAREIIHLHGGEISVRSEIGRGSTFEFWISQ